MGGPRWSAAEDAIVRAGDPKAIAALNRTRNAIAIRRVKLGVRSERSSSPWTPAEDNALRRGDLDALTRRTINAIRDRRVRIGMRVVRAGTWTAEDDAAVVAVARAAVWPDVRPDWQAVAARLGRTEHAVRQRASILRHRYRSAG